MKQLLLIIMMAVILAASSLALAQQDCRSCGPPGSFCIDGWRFYSKEFCGTYDDAICGELPVFCINYSCLSTGELWTCYTAGSSDTGCVVNLGCGL